MFQCRVQRGVQPWMAAAIAISYARSRNGQARQEFDRTMSAIVDYTLTGNGGGGMTSNSVLLGPLSMLARKRETWSPSLLAGVLWRGLTNIGRHREIRQVLKLSAFAEIARLDPRFAFKYLTHDYLVRRFTVAQRASCFAHHYMRLHAISSGSLLSQTLHREVPLFEIREGRNCFGISMSLSRPHEKVGELSYDLQHDKEGELSLYLQVNHEIVFVLSFTIVPGWVVKSEAAEVLLITRLQGLKGCYREISIATKALHDVAPGALLIAALQGVAGAFGIGELACIGATDQSSYCEDCAASFKTAYDDFFTERGVQKNAANFYLSPIPLPEKPLARVKQGHKLRTREKRVFKREVTDAVYLLLRESCRGDHLRASSATVSADSARSLRDLYADS